MDNRVDFGSMSPGIPGPGPSQSQERRSSMIRKLVLGALSLTTLVLVEPPVAAQGTPATASSFSKDQLEQMVAPIALYPDNLITSVLMAATYPLEIVEADRWLKKNKDLQGT